MHFEEGHPSRKVVMLEIDQLAELARGSRKILKDEDEG